MFGEFRQEPKLIAHCQLTFEVTSGTSVDVGPAVPAMLQDWITRKNVPETMKRVQRWVESDGSDRP